MATVGFVGSGLLGFAPALGIVFGANLGTTATGWAVALLGFKLELGRLMLPLLFGGVMLRLFGRRKFRDAGWAIAGFSSGGGCPANRRDGDFERWNSSVFSSRPAHRCRS